MSKSLAYFLPVLFVLIKDVATSFDIKSSGGHFSCGSQPMTCGSTNVKPGSKLSSLCQDLTLTVPKSLAASGLIIYFQPGACDVPDITASFSNPTGLEILATITDLSNSSQSLGQYSLPSTIPCGQGFIIGLFYSKADGSYIDHSSFPINVACLDPIEISLENNQVEVEGVEPGPIDPGAENPFNFVGVPDAFVRINGTSSCKINVIALITCEDECHESDGNRIQMPNGNKKNGSKPHRKGGRQKRDEVGLEMISSENVTDADVMDSTTDEPNIVTTTEDDTTVIDADQHPHARKFQGSSKSKWKFLQNGKTMKMYSDDLFDQLQSRINLNNTFIPMEASGNCTMSLILDPFEQCPDVNRTNNVLEFPIQISNSSTPTKRSDTCKIYPDWKSMGHSVIMVHENNKCIDKKKHPQMVLYQEGKFTPIESHKHNHDAHDTKRMNKIQSSESCGDKCMKYYQKYTIVKNGCPSSIFDPLLKIFSESRKSWSLVNSTSDETMQQNLEKIQAIAQANEALFREIKQSNAYTPLCQYIIKVLVKTFSKLQYYKQGDQDEDSNENEHSKNRNGVLRDDIKNKKHGLKGGNQGRRKVLEENNFQHSNEDSMDEDDENDENNNYNEDDSTSEEDDYSDEEGGKRENPDAKHGRGNRNSQSMGGKQSGHNSRGGKSDATSDSGNSGTNPERSKGSRGGKSSSNSQLGKGHGSDSSAQSEIPSKGKKQSGGTNVGSNQGHNTNRNPNQGNQGKNIINNVVNAIKQGKKHVQSSTESGNYDDTTGYEHSENTQETTDGITGFTDDGSESNSQPSMHSQGKKQLKGNNNQGHPAGGSEGKNINAIKQGKNHVHSTTHSDTGDVTTGYEDSENSEETTDGSISESKSQTNMHSQSKKQSKGTNDGSNQDQNTNTNSAGGGQGKNIPNNAIKQGKSHVQSTTESGNGNGETNSENLGAQKQGHNKGHKNGNKMTTQSSQGRRKRQAVNNSKSNSGKGGRQNNQDKLQENGAGSQHKHISGPRKKDHRHGRKVFPFGKWDWGLPDLGLLSGKPMCAASSSKKCKASTNVMDTWYHDCVCPWVWTGKANACPYGNDLSEVVAKANILYLKDEPKFPKIEGTSEIFADFISSFLDSPVAMDDIESMIENLGLLMSNQSGAEESETATLMASYLGHLSTDFKQGLFDLIKELQGITMFEDQQCDWSGEAGPPPLTTDLCKARTNYFLQQLHSCKFANESTPCSAGDSAANEVPIVWKNDGNTFKMGSYCPITQQWYWKSVASCGGGLNRCRVCKSEFDENDDGDEDNHIRKGGQNSENTDSSTSNARNGSGKKGGNQNQRGNKKSQSKNNQGENSDQADNEDEEDSENTDSSTSSARKGSGKKGGNQNQRGNKKSQSKNNQGENSDQADNEDEEDSENTDSSTSNARNGSGKKGGNQNQRGNKNSQSKNNQGENSDQADNEDEEDSENKDSSTSSARNGSGKKGGNQNQRGNKNSQSKNNLGENSDQADNEDEEDSEYTDSSTSNARNGSGKKGGNQNQRGNKNSQSKNNLGENSDQADNEDEEDSENKDSSTESVTDFSTHESPPTNVNNSPSSFPGAGQPGGPGDSQPGGPGTSQPGGAGSGQPGGAGSGQPGGAGSGQPRGAGSGQLGGAGSGQPEGAGSGQPGGAGNGQPEGAGRGQPGGAGSGQPGGAGSGQTGGAGSGQSEKPKSGGNKGAGKTPPSFGKQQHTG